MSEVNFESFKAEAIEKAQRLYAVTALTGGLNSLPANADKSVGNTREEIEHANGVASDLLKKREVLEKLCLHCLRCRRIYGKSQELLLGAFFPR